MTNAEFNEAAIRYFTTEIAELLGRATIVAKAAATLCEQGLTENAMETLYDAEPLIFDAKTLLDAASLVRRKAISRASTAEGHRI